MVGRELTAGNDKTFAILYPALSEPIAATSSATTVATFTQGAGTNTLALRAGGTTNYMSVDIDGDIVTAGDIAVNGGNITSSGALDIASGGSGALTLDSSSGTVTINSADILQAEGSIDFADAGADTLTLGDANDTTSITGNNWSVTSAGVGTFTQVNSDNTRLDGNALSISSAGGSHDH